jgi:hypothetical protein
MCPSKWKDLGYAMKFHWARDWGLELFPKATVRTATSPVKTKILNHSTQTILQIKYYTPGNSDKSAVNYALFQNSHFNVYNMN